MTTRAAFTNYLSDILPLGRFWEGPPAERFIDGTAGAFEELVILLCNLDRETAPFFAQRPVLIQWLDYLRRVDCVATPVDTEDLRDRVLALLGAESSAFPAGLRATVQGYLPFVEIQDDLPLSVLGFSATSAGAPLYIIPAPLDPHGAIVEVWFTPVIDSEALVLCVVRPFAPAVSVIRPVSPSAVFSHPVPASHLAGSIALHWDEMRSVSDLHIERRPLIGAPIEIVDVLDIAQKDIKTMDELFPLLGPGTSITGQVIEASFQRTWAGQTSQLLLPNIITHLA